MGETTGELELTKRDCKACKFLEEDGRLVIECPTRETRNTLAELLERGIVIKAKPKIGEK